MFRRRPMWMHRSPIWGLLAIWLFFGSLGLLEQLAPAMETSTQDEQALLRLSYALKPDIATGEEAQAAGLIPLITHASSSIHVYPERDSEQRDVLPPTPALRLHQLLSTYRI